MYNYCKSCEYWVRWIATLKSSPDVYYSERFKELKLAIHTLSNNQSLGISYIPNKCNQNKKFVLSIIKFLMIKAKYKVIEPYYIEDSTPDHLAEYVDEPYC